jgi:polysaccharide export outer membrane protein
MKRFARSLIPLMLLASGLAAAADPSPAVPVKKVADSVELALPDNISIKGVYSGSTEYRIGSQDLLEVSVFLNEDLKREVRVNSVGQISLPLIGTVLAGGKTVEELEQELMAAYGKSLLQNPQINVFIKEFTSQRVTIEGAVSKPGIYPIKGKTSLLQAVALAEGIDMNLARLDSILVFRTVNSQRMAAKFDLNLIRSGDAADPQIFGDDIIVVGVSSRKWAYRKFLESIPLVNAFILY